MSQDDVDDDQNDYEDQNKDDDYDENDDDEEQRYIFNYVGRMIIRDWCSTVAPPFLNFTIFLASRESEDDFPSDGDEESDEDSFDDETR